MYIQDEENQMRKLTDIDENSSYNEITPFVDN